MKLTIEERKEILSKLREERKKISLEIKKHRCYITYREYVERHKKNKS